MTALVLENLAALPAAFGPFEKPRTKISSQPIAHI
jgi:hypothetical protein